MTGTEETIENPLLSKIDKLYDLEQEIIKFGNEVSITDVDLKLDKNKPWRDIVKRVISCGTSDNSNNEGSEKKE